MADAMGSRGHTIDARSFNQIMSDAALVSIALAQGILPFRPTKKHAEIPNVKSRLVAQ